MNKKTCLIIDDEDQTDEIESLQRLAKDLHGIDLLCYQFNVGKSSFDEVLTDGAIDNNKVVIEFKKTFGKSAVFDLVALDFQLDDDKINGTELIRIFDHNKLLRNSPKMVYSGVLDILLREIIRDETPDRAVKKIKSMVKNNIIDYLNRDDLESRILEHLTTSPVSFNLIILDVLNTHPDLLFEHAFAFNEFEGKKFSEIAEILSQNIQLSNKFKREVIQQIISFLTEEV